MSTKKILNENNPENTIVRVVFYDNFKEEYECVGVLINDEEDLVRIAFSAKDEKTTDRIDIKRSDIVSIEALNPLDIEEL